MAGIDEFLDQVTVLPPGEWDPSIRIEPPKNVPSQVNSIFMSQEAHTLLVTRGKMGDCFRFFIEAATQKLLN